MIEKVTRFDSYPSADGPCLAFRTVELVAIEVEGAQVDFELRILERLPTFL